MAEPLLPELNRDATSVSVNKVGAWDYQDNVTFLKVANSLKLTGTTSDGVSSIPDMWARPLLMDIVLRNDRHEFYQDFKAQWKGMLAAIALTEVESFQLKAELVELPNQAINNTFIDGLISLIPSSNKAIYGLDTHGNPWQKIYVFLYKNKPVGMTSPSTIVCPSESGNWDEVPWFDGKKLQSPLAVKTENGGLKDCLNQDEKEQLWKWLDNLEQKVLAQNNSYGATIISLLNEFKQEIVSKYCQNATFPPIIILRNSKNTNYFGVPINGGVLDILHTPVAAKPMPSTVRIRSSKNSPVFIFLPTNKDKIKKELGQEPKDIWIYTTTNLVTFDLAEFKKLIESTNFKETTRGNIEFITEDELFLDDFYYIKGADLLPGACLPQGANLITYNDIEGSEQSLTPLLPINEKLLGYFTAEELTENYLKISPTNIGVYPGIEIELTLPLDGGNYRITKSYTIKEENAITQLPTLEIWPNFYAPGWQEYYVFYFYETDLTKKTFKIDFPQVAKRQETPLEGNVILEYNHLTNFPRFIRTQDPEKTQLFGLILLRTPPEVGNQNPDKTWFIGVDRGTSSTSVYYSINGSEAPVSLSHLADNSRFLMQITGKTGDALRKKLLYEYFCPPEKYDLPISTVLTTVGARGNTIPLLHGRVFIPPDIQKFDPNQEDIHTDLKWDSRPGQIIYQILFLKHLALMITAEAAKNHVRKIEWAISYPSAFSSEDIANYQATWNRIIDGRVEPNIGLNSTTGIVHSWRFAPHSESFALGHYFAQKVLGQNIPRQTCIDMGGGTSDICIWYNNALIHQCSVKLAGRDLFTQFLINKPEFIERQFSISLIEKGKNQDAKVDAFLFTKGKEWLENYRQNVAIDADLEQIVQLSALGIAGLYYYIGLVLLSLNLNGTYPRKEITPVFIGGNGSQILNWLSNVGQFNERCDANRLFSRMLSMASGWDDTRENTRLSQHPKAEVAWGLVLDHGNTRLSIPADTDGNDPIAGENFAINGQRFDYSDPVRMSGQIDSFDILDFTNLATFLKDFHSALEELNIKSIKPLSMYNQLDNQNWNNIWNLTKQQTEGALIGMRGASQNIRVEPPFIIGLRSLLKVLAEDLKKNKPD